MIKNKCIANLMLTVIEKKNTSHSKLMNIKYTFLT